MTSFQTLLCFLVPIPFIVIYLWHLERSDKVKHLAVCKEIYAEYGDNKSPYWVLDTLRK